MGKEIVAMILAGGRGTRLKELTAKVAKPAVHFGGKYRIIDFPLSNCANSGIDIVGVLTQYESVLLGTYVGAGTKWGLDGANSLAAILPARERDEVGATWYAGDRKSTRLTGVQTCALRFLMYAFSSCPSVAT